MAHCGLFGIESIRAAFSALCSNGGTGAPSLASSRRAFVGHIETQSPQPIQRLASLTARSSCIDRASMGHLSMQSPHPMHSSWSTAGIKLELASVLGEAALITLCSATQWQAQQLQMNSMYLPVLLEQCTSPNFSERSRTSSASSLEMRLPDSPRSPDTLAGFAASLAEWRGWLWVEDRIRDAMSRYAALGESGGYDPCFLWAFAQSLQDAANVASSSKGAEILASPAAEAEHVSPGAGLCSVP